MKCQYKHLIHRRMFDFLGEIEHRLYVKKKLDQILVSAAGF